MKNKITLPIIASALIFLGLIFGESVRIDILKSPRFTLSLIDIILMVIALFYFIGLFSKKRRQDFLLAANSQKFFLFIIFFLCFGLLSLISHSFDYPKSQLLNAFSYWIRLASVYFITVNVFLEVKSQGTRVIFNLFLIAASVLVIVGFIQLIVWPDFSNMAQFGWDPHQGRLLSTFYDPNFFGAFLVLVMAVSARLFFQKDQNLLRWCYIVLFLASWLALYLTYSRSAWFMGVIAIPLVVWPKNWKLSVVILAVFVGIIFIPGRLGSRIQQSGSLITGTTTKSLPSGQVVETGDPSASARMSSYKRGLLLIKSDWIRGVGYNAYGPASVKANIVDQGALASHAGQGSDSSLLNVLVTTGIIGLVLYLAAHIFLLIKLFPVWWQGDHPGGALFGYLIAFAAGSFFNNLLFYTLILMPLLVLIAITLKSYGEKHDGKNL